MKEYPNNMDRRLMRRRDKYNPYEIFSVGKDTDHAAYYLLFKDSNGVDICMQISKELFDVFDQFELDDLSFLNEYDNHMEHSVLTDASLYVRAANSSKAVDAEVEDNVRDETLRKAMFKLPEKQRRRLTLYYFEGYTYEEISEMENCTLQAVGKTILAAEKRLRKILTGG